MSLRELFIVIAASAFASSTSCDREPDDPQEPRDPIVVILDFAIVAVATVCAIEEACRSIPSILGGDSAPNWRMMAVSAMYSIIVAPLVVRGCR